MLVATEQAEEPNMKSHHSTSPSRPHAQAFSPCIQLEIALYGIAHGLIAGFRNPCPGQRAKKGSELVISEA